MKNLEIIEQFDAVEMGKFLSSVALQKWYDVELNIEWLNQESEDGLLHKGYMIWKDQQWVFDESKRPTVHDHNWVITHMPEILEFVLEKGNITSYNVLIVIPTMEYGHKFDDYKDVFHYKGINFTVWSDFFDYKGQEDIDDSFEGEQDYKKYLQTYSILKFMKQHKFLVNTIDIYYKNK